MFTLALPVLFSNYQQHICAPSSVHGESASRTKWGAGFGNTAQISFGLITGNKNLMVYLLKFTT